MNLLDFSFGDIEVMKYIKKHDHCTPQDLVNKFGVSSLGNAEELHKKTVIRLDSQTQQFTLLLRGAKVLRDYQLHKRSLLKERLINTGINLITTLIGVAFGFILSKFR